MMNRPRGSFEAIKSEISQSVLTIQKPSDFIVTLIYCIPILAPVRICIEAGLFEELSTCEHPKSADDLAEFLGQADGQAIQGHNERRDFVVRMLRVVAAIGGVDEHAEFMYSANEVTKAMADPGFAAGFQMIFDNVMGPQSTMSEMVRYHKENGWRAASSATDGPWQRARDRVGRSTFDSWISDDPIQLTRLSSFMQRMQRDRPHWTEWFPEDALFRKGGIDIVFVDMGGGRGHDLLALAKKYPDKTMSLVLQDLPAVIAGGEETRSQSGQALDKRIEVVKHSFFEPQPVQGANVYYMHKIMHDWPDEDCARILTRLRDAMETHSRIFINDVILPNQGCSLLHAAFDINMLALHSGQERDEQMWERLISKVDGLKVRKFWLPPENLGEGIVEVERCVS